MLWKWSKKSLPLREKGLKQVKKWLIDIKEFYSLMQDEAGFEYFLSLNLSSVFINIFKVSSWCNLVLKAGGSSLRNGVLLLSSCWKHYAMLLCFETQKCSPDLLQVLDQYLSALEVLSQDNFLSLVVHKCYSWRFFLLWVIFVVSSVGFSLKIVRNLFKS